MRLNPAAVLRSERGFTLVEIVVVLVLTAILLSISLSIYVSYRARAHDAAAQENIYILVPSIQAYYVETGGYAGITSAALKASYDAAIQPAVYSFGTIGQSTYCVQTTSGERTWRKNGPDSPLERQACP